MRAPRDGTMERRKDGPHKTEIRVEGDTAVAVITVFPRDGGTPSDIRTQVWAKKRGT